MLTPDQNERLTRVAGTAPMGQMIRQHYWLPFMRAARLARDGDPAPVRLLGRDYVVYRAADGRVAFFDAACPHRGASLLLARSEGDGLRCIFHGWKLDVGGHVSAAPSEGDRAAEFVRHLRSGAHPVREAGLLLWVWLGEGTPPAFPAYEFTSLPDDHLYAAITPVACNWVQGVEGTLDSAHVGLLHQSWIARLAPGSTRSIMATALAPRYECEPQAHGLRAVALRDLPDGSQYARIGEFVLPFTMFVGSSNAQAGERTVFLSVPVDDENSLLIYLRYCLREVGPLRTGIGFTTDQAQDPDNFAPLRAGVEARWGQDRAAMRAGHFTGFTDNILTEDIVVQVSMGRIADRSREQLGASDLAVVQARRLLLAALAASEAGQTPPGAQPGLDFAAIRADSRVLPPGQRWRDLYAQREP